MTAPTLRSLQATLKQRVAEILELPSADPLRLGEPPSPDHGDLAVGCHPLAKSLRRSPQELAEQVAAAMQDDPQFRDASAAGGYLNVRIDRPLLLQMMQNRNGTCM